METKVRNLVGAFVGSQDKILLVQHMAWKKFMLWEVPGGKVGKETLEQAVKRETKHEANIDIELTAIIGRYPGFTRAGNPTLTTYYTADVVGGELLANREIYAVEFFKAEEIYQLNQTYQLHHPNVLLPAIADWQNGVRYPL